MQLAVLGSFSNHLDSEGTMIMTMEPMMMTMEPMMMTTMELMMMTTMELMMMTTNHHRRFHVPLWPHLTS
jgi:hypothetical protein